MPDATAEITALIQPLQAENPQLYQALLSIQNQLQGVYFQLNPLIEQSRLESAFGPPLEAPTAFSFSFTPFTVRFHWSEVPGVASYEIRKGTDWDSASFVLRTLSLQADIDPLLYGPHTYLLKTITFGGVYSDVAASVVVEVPQIPAAPMTTQVIDNNVLLYWTPPPSSFAINYYEILRDGVSQGQVRGTFFTRFEATSGTYTYTLRAFDVAGNQNIESNVILSVSQPPDFELQDTRQSDFSGTKVNTHDAGDHLVCSVNTTETFENHFLTRGWSGPSAQVAAGFPIYAQPAVLVGTYEERIDYGTILSNLAVTIIYNQIQVMGFTTVGIQMQVSSDDITYTPYTTGSAQFFPTFRYLRFKMTFTGSDTTALLIIFALTIRLDVKREQDGGIATALSTDVAGTSVLFNKDFKDIDSITTTPMSTVERKAVIDFLDAPDPSGFKVYLFDSAGARVSGDVRWIARGVV